MADELPENDSPQQPAPEAAPAPAKPAEAKPAGGAGGGPAKQQPGFQVIRTAPAADEGGPPVGLIVGGVLLVAVIGYALMSGGTSTTKVGPDASPSPSPTEAEVPVPDYIWEKIAFLEEQGQAEQALAEVEKALAEYPNKELRAAQRRIRTDLGLDGAGRGAAGLLEEANKAIKEGDLAKARPLLEQAVEADPKSGAAYFALGTCLGDLGEKLDALNALEEARSLGYDAAKVNEAMKRYQ